MVKCSTRPTSCGLALMRTTSPRETVRAAPSEMRSNAVVSSPSRARSEACSKETSKDRDEGGVHLCCGSLVLWWKGWEMPGQQPSSSGLQLCLITRTHNPLQPSRPHLCARVCQRFEAHRLVQGGVAALQPLLELGLHLALARHRARQHLGEVVTEQQLEEEGRRAGMVSGRRAVYSLSHPNRCCRSPCQHNPSPQPCPLNPTLLRVTRKAGPKKSAPRRRRKASSGMTSYSRRSRIRSEGD